MRALVDLLLEKNLSISSCESFTSGLFGYELGRIPGVSAVYKGTLVAYQTEVKHRVLGIDKSILEHFGVVSQETAEQMARAFQRMVGSDVCVSFTGNAGPAILEGKPRGLWFACIRIQDEQYDFKFHDVMERNELQIHAVEVVKSRLIELIRDMPNECILNRRGTYGK